MKFLLATVALSLFLYLPSESTAQSPGGQFNPVAVEPAAFCLFRSLRIERGLGAADNYSVSTEAVFKSDVGGSRSADVSLLPLYTDVELLNVWDIGAADVSSFPLAQTLEFNATLDLEGGGGVEGGAGVGTGPGDYQSLPGPHAVDETDLELVEWNSGIAYCLANDFESAKVIQTARFHGALGGLFELKFYIWDFNSGNWQFVKTVPLDAHKKELVGIDFVELDLHRVNDADMLGPMNFTELGCRLRVEAKYEFNEQVTTLNAYKDIGLWTTVLP